MTLIERQRRVVDPPPPTAEVLFKEARQRRRRRRQIGLILVVVLALIAAAVVRANARGGPSTSGVGVQPSPSVLPLGTPTAIVGWTSDFHLVVLSARTGVVLRTLASNVDLEAPGLPDISVTTDGEVYFDSAPISGASPADAQGDQIFRVPFSGGPVVEVGPGYDPQVSPDGEFLAYVASNGVGEAPYLSEGRGIVIAPLVGGGVGGVETLHPSASQVNQGLSDLSWSPDSRRLSFNLLDSATQATTSWTIAPSSAGGTMASAKEIPLSRASLTWGGYSKSPRGDSPLGVGILTTGANDAGLADAQTVVAINPLNGNVVSRYFSVPGDVCTDDPSSSCVSDFNSALSVDSIGSSVLVAGTIGIVGGSVATSGRTFLYRWSTNSPKPVKLAEDVLAAAWGPAR